MNIPTKNISILLLIGWLLSGLAACSSQNEETQKIAGNELYATNCSTCHGTHGEGAESSIDLHPQSVPDLRTIAAKNDGVFPRDRIRNVIDGRELIDAHNREMMPRWGHEFLRTEGYSKEAEQRVDQKIEALVDFVESIQKK